MHLLKTVYRVKQTIAPRGRARVALDPPARRVTTRDKQETTRTLKRISIPQKIAAMQSTIPETDWGACASCGKPVTRWGSYPFRVL